MRTLAKTIDPEEVMPTTWGPAAAFDERPWSAHALCLPSLRLLLGLSALNVLQAFSVHRSQLLLKVLHLGLREEEALQQSTYTGH